MIGLHLFSETGQSLGQIAGDYFKRQGSFVFDKNTPLDKHGRAFIDYPAFITKDGKRHRRERIYFVSYEADTNAIISPITITATDKGFWVYHSLTFKGAVVCPCVIDYGYVNEIPL
ncbi:hypothetical protein [Moraxella ovis]|uniref:hypothetical protein n=1 Tax=Moraxella ovis TaxID=29433 RepID=UPI000D8D0316|nr:hypothetical protein [Moraxella ovis]SPX85327.1 Uncharacterised protein [Moraxella ovis]STZ06369.1 Uncharacterised protein [Moraxella ovis]